ncbi:hypothetical protein KM043_006671 [Ampulex compressa]|nr:hypothetical protein KM043_006671 [Ampulex compressa]
MLHLVRYCSPIIRSCNVANTTLFLRNIRANIPKRTIIGNGLFIKKVDLSHLRKGIRQHYITALNYSSKPIKKSDKIVGSWMLVCSGMVFVAVVLGGITRLTESGLSMVTWKLLGEKMPTTHVQWVAEFERYKQYPEFKITNKDMTLEEFKRIWWMEYLHRTWGRLIGGVFIVPASYFWFKDKWIPDDIFALSPKLKNFTENPTTLQFDHRILGISTLTLITCMGAISRKHILPGKGAKAITAVLCAGYLQVLLGISTLLYHVPLVLAAAHQSGSLILLSSMIWLCHELKYLKKIPK